MNLKLILVLSLFCSACHNSGTKTNTSKKMAVIYPLTEKDTTIQDVYFGTSVADPYRWLENDTSIYTANWVKKENEVTENYLKQIPFRQSIRKRYSELFNYEKFSAPSREGKFIYYSKNSGLQNQFVVFRELVEGGVAEIFLDPNTFSADGTISLSGTSFSKDGSMVAYTISEGGSDWQKMIVMNAITRKQVGDTLRVKFSRAAWKGIEGFYYSTYDLPKKGSMLAGVTDNHKLYFHRIGTAQKEDQLIFAGTDLKPYRYIDCSTSEDGKWLWINCANSTYGNELMVLDLSKPDAKIINLVADMKNQHYILFSDDQYFYIQSDRNAPTGKLVIAPINQPEEKYWKTFLEAKPEVLSASAAGGTFYCSYLKDAVTKVYQIDRAGKLLREIKLPGLGTASGFNTRMEDKELYFGFTGYTMPYSVYKLNIENGNSTLFKQPKVQFDPNAYESHQEFYLSKDGSRIPMIITHKKGLKLDGENPCLLYGYGGFGASITPFFSTSGIILLENGGVFAVANIRGGGEYGETWHEQGIKLKKQNVFDDFIAAAQFLVDNKYTSRDKLAIQGESNGGLLVGACITQQPSMCKVAFPFVGVMDMLRYHKFTAGAGWAYDYGTSDDSKEMFDYLLKYSPLHNIRDTSYPATLIVTADHDDRVVPAHSFKFAASLQESQKGPDPVLIRIESKAGHGAGKSTNQIIAEQTDKWSFMFYNMGITPKY